MTKLKFLFVFIIIFQAKAQKSGFETSGDVLQLAIPAVAFGSTFFYKDNQKPLWQFIEVYGTQLVVSQSLKRIINKPRPDNNGIYSFPSGHTSSAFSGAAFMQIRYGWKVGTPAYVLASYVGWTRIEARKHDAYDVLGGATIGILSAYLFTKPYHKKTFEMGFGKINDANILNFNYIF